MAARGDTTGPEQPRTGSDVPSFLTSRATNMGPLQLLGALGDVSDPERAALISDEWDELPS